jgi:hypothetical protein
MFEGHMLEINGTILPNEYIDMSTYKCSPHKRRLIDSWYDGNGVKHEVYSQHTTTEVEFASSGMFMAKRQKFLAYFPSNTGLAVRYYNDQTGVYETGTFRTNDFTFERYKIRGNNIIYKAMNITLSED